MLRSVTQISNLKHAQGLMRLYSVEAARKVSNFQEEWDKARPYDQIPKLTKISLIRGFLPGGKV